MKQIQPTLKSKLIRKIMVDTAIPEKIVEKVINHQFASAQSAMLNHYSIELSGFGKFLFKPVNARRYLKNLNMAIERMNEKLLVTEAEPTRIYLSNLIRDYTKYCGIIEKKLDGLGKDL